MNKISAFILLAIAVLLAWWLVSMDKTPDYDKIMEDREKAAYTDASEWDIKNHILY